jgi:DNA-binding transcriptional LysR family regulator
MSNKDLDWQLCRSFLAVLQEGNLSRAARALRLSQPTLGRHIDEIERVVQAPLFRRSPQGMLPTDAAFMLRPHAEAMAAAAQAFVRAASGEGDGARGTVRITAPELLGVEILPPILTALREKYPNIVVELSITHRNEDLVRREADIAVRMRHPTQAALVARRVGETGFALYAHRSYVERHGLPKTFAELKTHVLVGFDKENLAVQAHHEMGSTVTREWFSFRSDSAAAQLSAMRAGYGIGGCMVQIARREVDLIPVLPDAFLIKRSVYVVMHESERKTKRLRSTFDYLATALSAFWARPRQAR